MASISLQRTNVRTHPSTTTLELVCPAANPAALRAAVENGADWIRLDHRPSGGAETIGSFSSDVRLAKAILFAHDRKRKIVLNLPSLSPQESWSDLCTSIAVAHDVGIDAVMLSDPGLMLYAAVHYPKLRVHYTMPAIAASGDMITHIRRQFGVTRLAVPRLLSFAQLATLAGDASVELEVIGFSPLFAATALSRRPSNLEETRSYEPGAHSAYHAGENALCLSEPSVSRCATDDDASNDDCYTEGNLDTLSVLTLLPRLAATGIRAIQVDVAADAPGEVARVTRIWREAIDDCFNDVEHYVVKPTWIRQLNRLRGRRSPQLTR